MARSSPAPAIRAPRFPKYAEVIAGPWNTLNDSNDTSNAAPDVAKRLDNVYNLDGASTLGRPGAVQAGAAAAPGTVQAHGQLTKPDGTEITFRVCNGVIQSYDWAGTWTTVVSAANLATASVTLSATARCAAVEYNGKMVISDGINKPFTWTGASGAGGLTSLTATAGAWYGVPAVKDAKLFGIQASNRLTIEWSLENDATSGYGTQTWSLGQVSETPLTAIVGLNDALIVFRERMCQPIIGNVNATYKTSATRASLSENIGTKSPFAVQVINNRVFFIDADGRPQVIAAGTGMLYEDVAQYGPDAAPFWKNLREFSLTVDRTKLATKACASWFPQLGLVMLGMPQSTATNANVWVMIDPRRNVPVSLWSGFEFVCPAIVKDTSGIPYVMFADGSNYSYTFGDVRVGPFDDQLASGTVAVNHVIEASPLAPDRDTETQWFEMAVSLRSYGNQTLAISAAHPYGSTTPLSFFAVGSVFFLDISKLDINKIGDAPVERNINVGFNVPGRWIRPIITHNTVGENFGVVGVAVHGAQTRDDPSAR